MSRLAIVVVIALQLVANAALAAWHENSRSPEQATTLAAVDAAVAGNQKPVVIFDLDSTLYKNVGRWAVIAREYGKSKGITQLASLTAAQITYSFDPHSVLVNDAKLDPAVAKEILPDFQAFWTQRFFNNDYVKHDAPLPGAAAFVKGLYDKGATIVYITGRDEQNMRAGTTAKLKSDGFPIDMARTALFMKQTPNKAETLPDDVRRQRDTAAKEAVLATVAQMGTVVASFENEPATINLYFDHFHHKGAGVAVFLDTDMAPNPKPVALRAGVQTISGFLR